MGMYTGLRFRGKVKKEFVKEFENKNVFDFGNWQYVDHEDIMKFGKTHPRADFIPNGVLCYMPDEWDNLMSKSNLSGDFMHRFDVDSGLVQFQCSLKNYDNEIKDWIELLPIFIEEVYHCEVFYEEWDYSHSYILKDNCMILDNTEFIDYSMEYI